MLIILCWVCACIMCVCVVIPFILNVYRCCGGRYHHTTPPCTPMTGGNRPRSCSWSSAPSPSLSRKATRPCVFRRRPTVRALLPSSRGPVLPNLTCRPTPAQACGRTSRGQTAGRSHRGFLHLPSAVLALFFLARRI